MPPKIITKKQFRDFMRRGVAVVEGIFGDERPIGPIMPALIVICDVMKEDHEPGQGTYIPEIVAMPNFDDNRYDLMKVNGRKFAHEKKMVVMVVLITEAWMVIKPIAEYNERRVQPRDDPSRQDIVMVCGMALDQYTEMMRAYITRDKQGRGTLGRFVRMLKNEDFLLGTFYAHYAIACIEGKR